MQRARRGHDVNLLEIRNAAYRVLKKDLARTIARAKTSAWRTFTDSVEADVWGRPYLWVSDRIKGRSPPASLGADEVAGVVRKLFVTEPPSGAPFPRAEDILFECPASPGHLFSEGEVEAAINKVKRRAAGVDGISSCAVWALGREALSHIAHLFNTCLTLGYFPEAWKVDRFVLIPKKPGPGGGVSWRPLCLLSNFSKAFEYCLKERLASGVAFASNQFGFVKRKSTVDAMRRLIDTWDAAKRTGLHCVMVALDVRNAFNTIRHCSVLGFADDVALLVGARSAERVVALAEQTLARIHAWFRDNHLELAEEKTEVLHLTGRKAPEALQLALGSASLRGSGGSAGYVSEAGRVKAEERLATLGLWLVRWDAARHGRWTHRLIPNISEWVQWGPKMLSFHLTQFLCGHGCFAEYLSRMGFTSSDLCLACGRGPDDPVHAFLECGRFAAERDAAERAMGSTLVLNNVMAILKDERTRGTFVTYVTNVAKQREQLERDSQPRRRTRARNPRVRRPGPQGKWVESPVLRSIRALEMVMTVKISNKKEWELYLIDKVF
ncbi:uncharacterized protein LOC143259839 [Megalopta genalis]|uniref:uncharacterized protein LOC143259839 n=1 Tax=Megalopta genalis TaxID=115081 RepID=UPI003FD20BFA